MNDRKEDKVEERIRFLAKHYNEGSLDTEKAWKQLTASKGIRHIIPFRRYLLAIASVALLLIGIGSLYVWNKNTPEWILISTAPDQLKDVYLPDSTFVNLAGGTSIRYNAKKYGKTRRDVEMNGKAFFRVARDESRPFSVYTKMAEVEVLGTSFQVNERPSSIEVNVAEGKVKFTAGENEKKENIILTAGMSANYSMETREIKVLTEENTNYLSWKTGLLRFHNTPLEKVIEDLTDYYNIPVKSRMMIRGEKLTATFNSLPLDQVLLIINQTLDVRLVIEKGN